MPASHRIVIGGDMFVTPAGMPHGSGGTYIEKALFYWLLIRLPKRGIFLNLPATESRSLIGRLSSLPKRVFHADSAFAVLLDSIIETVCEDGPLAFRAFVIRARLYDFLLRVIAAGERGGVAAVSAPVARVLAFIDRHPEDASDIATLARVSGLSRSRLRSRFKAETGFPPAEYLLRRRIETAKRLLAVGFGLRITACYERFR